jgi:hypothetical protein
MESKELGEKAATVTMCNQTDEGRAELAPLQSYLDMCHVRTRPINRPIADWKKSRCLKPLQAQARLTKGLQIGAATRIPTKFQVTIRPELRHIGPTAQKKQSMRLVFSSKNQTDTITFWRKEDNMLFLCSNKS